jgi:hypothetical protein
MHLPVLGITFEDGRRQASPLQKQFKDQAPASLVFVHLRNPPGFAFLR